MVIKSTETVPVLKKSKIFKKFKNSFFGNYVTMRGRIFNIFIDKDSSCQDDSDDTIFDLFELIWSFMFFD